jgi:hypothetical protein
MTLPGHFSLENREKMWLDFDTNFNVPLVKSRETCQVGKDMF